MAALNIKIKLESGAVMPKRAYPSDAGLDLCSYKVSSEIIDDVLWITVDTGVAVDIPKGYVGLVYPRSSITKTRFMLGNCVGVIDAGYRGNIKLKFRATPGKSENYFHPKGKVAQLIIQKLPEVELFEVEEFDDLTDRGDGGFGSTDLVK